MGAGKGRTRRTQSVFQSRRSRASLSTEDVAAQAVQLGLKVRAKKVFAAFSDDRTVSASEHGVSVTQNPHDLPFMEHAEYGAVPRTLLSASVDEFRGDTQREELFAAAREFMSETQASMLRIDLPEGQELYANQAELSLSEEVKRRYLPGSKREPVRSEPVYHG